MIVGDGRKVAARGQGDIIVMSKTGRRQKLKNVLYVPELEYCLYSVRQAQANKQTISFPFDRNRFMFVKSAKGERICAGEIKRNNLYVMDFQAISKETVNQEENLCVAVSEMLLHQRLGHVSYRKINRMRKTTLKGTRIKKNTNDMRDEPCMGCVKAKLNKRKKTKCRSREAGKMLESSHCDLIGPFKSGINGLRYVLTVVDEKSRHGAVYFLKRKAETFSKFKLYKAKAENHMEN